MPNPFDDWLADLAERGLDPEDVETGRQLMAASPIRKERDEWKTKAESFRAAALRSTFKDVGIKLSPDVLRIPDDLDPDVDKVREWAVKGGLIEAPAPTAEQQAAEEELNEDLDASERVAAAHAGAKASHSGVITPDDAAGWSTGKFAEFEKKHPREADALARGEVVAGITF